MDGMFHFDITVWMSGKGAGAYHGCYGDWVETKAVRWPNDNVPVEGISRPAQAMDQAGCMTILAPRSTVSAGLSCCDLNPTDLKSNWRDVEEWRAPNPAAPGAQLAKTASGAGYASQPDTSADSCIKRRRASSDRGSSNFILLHDPDNLPLAQRPASRQPRETVWCRRLFFHYCSTLVASLGIVTYGSTLRNRFSATIDL